MPVSICAKAVCAIAPLITLVPDHIPGQPLPNVSESVKSTHKKRLNPSPWPDAVCQIVDYYVTYDPRGSWEGQLLHPNILKQNPEIEYEKRIYCWTRTIQTNGYYEDYFPLPDQSIK